MLNSRQKSEWERTALQTTILANCWAGKGAKLHVADFPYCEKPEQRINTPEKLKWFIETFMKGLK